jgi:sarcosine oxidase, subunit gamma
MGERVNAAIGPAPLALAGAAGPIRLCEAACRFSIRVREGDVAIVGEASGFRFDTPVNRWTGQKDRLAARLGPDEWLFIDAQADAEKMSSALHKTLSNCPSSIVDISHRQVAFEISGPNADFIVNSGCPLDLHPSAAPVGFATRTLLGKAEIIVFRLEEPAAYRVECWRSFSTYVHGFLLEAARDCSASD